MENLGYWSKYYVFGIKNFEVLGCSHLEFEVLGISSKILSILKYYSLSYLLCE